MSFQLKQLLALSLSGLFALLASNPAFASRSKNDPFGACISAFPELEKKTGEAVAKPSEYEANRSVEILGSQSGPHGGKRLHIKRLEKGDGQPMEWASKFAERHYDLQGDPRTFVSAIGLKAAGYFGFEKINEAEYFIPDAVEFESALRKINNQLISTGQSPLSFRFFLANSNADIQVKKYVDRIRTGLLMPLAPDGHHLIHDLAFHAGMIFGPSALGRLMKAEADLHASFFEYLNEKYKTEPSVLPLIQSLQYVSNFIDTMRFDGLTGSLGQTFALIRSENSEMLFEHVSERMQSYLDFPAMYPSPEAIHATGRKPEAIFITPNGLSLADRFLTFLIILQNPAHYQTPSFTRRSHLNMSKLDLAMKSSAAGYRTSQLISDFHEFVSRYKSPIAVDIRANPEDILLGIKGAFKRDSDQAATERNWYEIFCDEVRKNKLRVIEAVELLQQKL